MDFLFEAIPTIRQKAPSAKRCIKTVKARVNEPGAHVGQKAPSAKRCIKTSTTRAATATARRVRKHRAPNGALRQSKLDDVLLAFSFSVRKHRAPNGALRPFRHTEHHELTDLGQKAPSAKRCIKTREPGPHPRRGRVRKHRAPNGALRPEKDFERLRPSRTSESTERQTVH